LCCHSFGSLYVFRRMPPCGCWPVLLVASDVFHGIGGSIFWRFWQRRRAVLGLSRTGNLSILIGIKYRLFFGEALGVVAPVAGGGISEVADVILPAGLSFYTLLTIGYTIDVYRRRFRTEPHLGYFAFYVAYFPQRVAGPIERAGRLLPQFRAFASSAVRWLVAVIAI